MAAHTSTTNSSGKANSPRTASRPRAKAWAPAALRAVSTTAAAAGSETWKDGRTEEWDGQRDRTDRRTDGTNCQLGRVLPPLPTPGTPRLPAPLTQLGVPDAHVALQQVVHPARRRHLQVVWLRTGEWPGERRAGPRLINLWWLLGKRAAGHTRLRIDDEWKIGLGVTPSGWIDRQQRGGARRPAPGVMDSKGAGRGDPSQE